MKRGHCVWRAAISRIALFVLAGFAIQCGEHQTVVQAPEQETDWPMYGHDLRHTFTAVQAAVDRTNVTSLQLAWKVPMADAVSAPPSVVGGVVYIGAWDG